MQQSERNKQQSSKILPLIAAFIIASLTLLWFTTDVIDSSLDWIKQQNIGQKKSLQTYYQWTDRNGKLIISRSPPKGDQAFITFQGSDDLMTIDNKPRKKAKPSLIDRIAGHDNSGTTRFSCDGRQYCSQMTSRAEAEFFLKNCPNTKMDGDRDGKPCENDSRF